MKSKIVLALLALAGSSFGALVSLESLQTFDGTGDTGFKNSAGPMTSGLVRVGIFTTLTDLQVLGFATALDFDSLNGALTTLASDNFTGVETAYGSAIPGLVSMNASGIVATGSETLYTMASKNGEWALFKHNSVLVPDPALPALENTYALSLTDGQILVGSQGGTYVADYSGLNGPSASSTVVSRSIALIPEPSAALLGALGALGLLRRRRN
ncbi:MAG: hypothetical protein RLZZ398_1630 [Verrucomicrobiota bacterium]|jgi:hypothetical protein